MIQLFERMTMGRAIIIGALITAIYYFFIFDSGEVQMASIHNSTNEIQRLQNELAQVNSRLKQAQDFQNASQSLGNSIQKLLSYIPANFTIGQLMKTVSQEARVAGLDISQMQPKVGIFESKVEDFTELGITVELKGQYDQLLSFMSSLTRKRQIFIFERLELTGDPAAGANGLVKISAEIHAFSYRGTQ